MLTSVTNILAGVLGVGVTATSIAVPVAVLSSSNSAKQTLGLERNTHSQEAQQAIPSTTTSGVETETNSPEKDCYGGFLSQEGEGELVFCVEKEKLDFYLHWTKDGKQELIPIEKINVSVISQSKELEVWFVKKGQMAGIKKIIVQKNGHDNLNWMSFQTLKNICTRTQDESGIFLSCDYKFTDRYFSDTKTYKHSVREIKFEQSLLGGA